MSSPRVIQFEVGLLQNFNYLVSCPETREAAIVDPAFEPETILARAQEEGLRITSIWVTHGHPDHIEAVPALAQLLSAPVYVHPLEADKLRDLSPRLLAEGETLRVGQVTARALHTPGHTQGGICYDLGDAVITGDLLFVRGCGRSDFPGGDTRALWESLQRLRRELPPDYRVYPGHDYGPSRTSTLEEERHENPFLRCRSFEEFQALREGRRRRGL
jgi:hydroxyacylglutathione hydrolase